MFKQSINIIKTIVFILVIFLSMPLEMTFATTYSKKTIVVMPFIKGKKADLDVRSIDTAITDFPYMDNSLTVNADSVMTILVHKALSKKFADVIPTDQAAAAYDSLVKEGKDLTMMALAIQLGESLGADYVVTGNVWRYKERSGNAFASSKPASVAFKLNIIKVAAKTRIWKGMSEKTQEALSSNLLKTNDFIKQGSKWLSVNELASKEIEKMLKTFPVKHEE